jgi:hypothetical protein
MDKKNPKDKKGQKNLNSQYKNSKACYNKA